ncbi:hypothetical protein [Prevotella koreensis]
MSNAHRSARLRQETLSKQSEERTLNMHRSTLIAHRSSLNAHRSTLIIYNANA